MKTRHYTPEIKERAVACSLKRQATTPLPGQRFKPSPLRLAAHLRPCDPGIKSTSIKLFLPQYKRKVIKNASKSLNARIKNLSKLMKSSGRLRLFSPRRRRAAHRNNGRFH